MKTPTKRQMEYYEAFLRCGSKAAAARELGVKRQVVSTAVAIVQMAKGEPTQPAVGTQTAVVPDLPQTEGNDKEVSGVVYVEKKPTTLDEVLAKFQMDPDVWKVKKWKAGEWNGLAKTGKKGEEEVKIVTLYKISVEFEALPGVNKLKAVIEALTADGRARAPKWSGVSVITRGNAGVLSLNIPDLHLGKLAWPPETEGPAYDVKIAAEVYRDAMHTLIGKAKRNQWKPERILLPIGNDFYNCDQMVQGSAAATTAGTYQDEDGRQQRSFTEGVKIQRDTIAALQAAFGVPVDVKVVPGNHDKMKVFYLGVCLEIAFENHRGVVIDNAPTKRKYFVHDRILIGMTHGEAREVEKLPLVMAHRFALNEFVTREWYLAHLHHRRGRSYETEVEVGPMHMRGFSSLSSPDAYHAESGYDMSARHAEAHYYGGDCRHDGTVDYFA